MVPVVALKGLLGLNRLLGLNGNGRMINGLSLNGPGTARDSELLPCLYNHTPTTDLFLNGVERLQWGLAV